MLLILSASSICITLPSYSHVHTFTVQLYEIQNNGRFKNSYMFGIFNDGQMQKQLYNMFQTVNYSCGCISLLSIAHPTKQFVKVQAYMHKPVT